MEDCMSERLTSRHQSERRAKTGLPCIASAGKNAYVSRTPYISVFFFFLKSHGIIFGEPSLPL